MPYFGGIIRPNWYIVSLHTEQWFNTNHPSSVVFLLGQKQDCLLSLHSYSPVHGCLSHHLRRKSIIFGPVKVYRGKKGYWTTLIVMCFTMHIFFCPEQQTLVTKKTSRPSLCYKWSNSLLEKVWEQCYMWYPAANSSAKHRLSIAPFPDGPPSFHHLSFSKQQKARRQPEKESTQSTLWVLYSLQEKLHTHTKYKSIPAAVT